MGHPGVALRDLEASRDALSRGRYQPQPTERRLSCSHRVTFLTGANRDFPNWRRQSHLGKDRVQQLPAAATSAALGVLFNRSKYRTIAMAMTTILKFRREFQ